MTDLGQLAAWIAANPEQYATLRAQVLTDAGRDPDKNLPPKGSMMRRYLDSLICEAIRKHNGWPAGRSAVPIEEPVSRPAPPPAAPKLTPPPAVERTDYKALRAGEK